MKKVYIKDKNRTYFIPIKEINQKPYKRGDNRYFVRDDFGTLIELSEEDYYNLGGE